MNSWLKLNKENLEKTIRTLSECSYRGSIDIETDIPRLVNLLDGCNKEISRLNLEVESKDHLIKVLNEKLNKTVADLELVHKIIDSKSKNNSSHQKTSNQ